jgi:ABC-type antimicrobial peptide transport system permease subunit
MWTKELRRHRGRTASAAAAVATATALLVSMLSISNGIIDTVESSIRDSSADLLVGAAYDSNFGEGHAIAANLTNWNEIEFATPVLRTLVSVSSGRPGSQNFTPVALGIIPDQFRKILPDGDGPLMDGWFDAPGDPHFGGNYTQPWVGDVVLSTQLSGDLGVAKGESITVRDSLGTQRSFRIVGTLATQLSPERIIQEVRLAFFRLSELQDLTGVAMDGAGANRTVSDEVNRIYISMDPAQRLVPDAARVLRDKVETAYPDFAGLVSTKQDRLDRLQSEYAVARLFYTAIGFVSLLIGLLFVACVVVISVSERTRDIGALRAIGVSRRSIFSMILAESVVLVTAGTVVGLLPAYAASLVLGTFVASSQGVAPPVIMFSADLVGGAVARVVALGAAVSLYPAWRATRVPVVQALLAQG